MDLIKKLGGYEKALDLFRGCPWDSGTVDVPNPRSKGMLRLDLSDLSYELLEYRRQHNIFEVGDKVKAKDHQFGFDELFRVDDFFANDDGVNLAVLDDGDCYPISFLEHATKEEIAVGHRL